MGNIGGVSSSVEDGQTGADSSDGSGDGTQMGSITFSQDTVGYAGTWVPFEDGFQLYLPSDWDVYNVTEEQSQQGVLYIAGDSSGAETAPGISVVWAYSDGAETIEEVAAAIGQGGYQVDDIVSILPDRGKRLQRYHVFPSHQQAVPVLRNRRGIRG